MTTKLPKGMWRLMVGYEFGQRRTKWQASGMAYHDMELRWGKCSCFRGKRERCRSQDDEEFPQRRKVWEFDYGCTI